MMAFLAEAVRLAAGPQVAAHKDFKGLELLIKEQPVLGSLTVIVRP